MTTPLADSRGLPCCNGFVGQPHRQASASDQRDVVFRPVRDPVFDPRDLVAAALFELVGMDLTCVGRPQTVPPRRRRCQRRRLQLSAAVAHPLVYSRTKAADQNILVTAAERYSVSRAIGDVMVVLRPAIDPAVQPGHTAASRA